jgi:hypothetical protein
MICKFGEGAQFPTGTAVLTQMLGDKVAVFEPPIPLDALWLNLAGARHSPEYVYWLHPADYDAAVRMFKKISKPTRRLMVPPSGPRGARDRRGRYRTAASQRTHQRGRVDNANRTA